MLLEEHRNTALIAALMVGVGVLGTRAQAGDDKSEDNNIAILDKCDPADPGWAPTGGCTLKKGDVSFAEFGALLFTPLGPVGSLIGHPAWRNEPSYLSLDTGKKVRVVNLGGRVHTFTEVADFGGGFVPPLNGALSPAPACLAAPTNLAPGASANLTGLAVGLHKFQCCIHPWMRAAIRVSPKKNDD